MLVTLLSAPRSHRHLLLASAVVAPVLWAMPARAQGAADTTLPTIDVQGQQLGVLSDTQGFVSRRDQTGTKTDTPLNEIPQSISVINREQLDSRQVQSLGEGLRYTSGVLGESFGADPHVDFFSIRGFNANDTGLYLNGLRLSPGITALAPEPYGLERIDVLKGPASALYGQNSPGGLVNLVSKRPTETPLHEVTLLGGSFGRIQGQFDLGGPIGGQTSDGKWSYRLTGMVRDAGTQVDRVPNDRQFIAPAITYRNGDTTVTLLTSYQHDHSAGQQFLPSQGTVFGNPNGRIPTNRFTGEDQYNKVDRTQVNLGYELEHRFNDVFTVRQNVRFTRIDYSQRQVFGLGLESDLKTLDRFAYGQDVRANLFTVDNQGQAKFNTGPLAHTVLGGFDFNHSTTATVNRGASGTPINIYAPVYGVPQVDPLGIYTNAYQTQNLYGIYLQDQVKWNRFILTAGIREDLVDTTTRDKLAAKTTSQSDSKFTYRFGLGYEAPLGFTPYVSYARSFLPVVGVNASGQAFRPTSGDQVEAGVKYQPAGIASYVTAAAFEINQTNVSTTDPSNPVNTLQTGAIRVRGFEVEGQANLARGLNLLAAYTYLDPIVTQANDGTVGKTVGAVPRHAASGWIDYAMAPETKLAGLSFGGGVRFVGSTQASNADLFKVSDHTLVDAAIRYDFGRDSRWRLAVNANNLFDRTFVAQCTGAAFCFYGARREVLASLGVRW